MFISLTFCSAVSFARCLAFLLSPKPGEFSVVCSEFRVQGSGLNLIACCRSNDLFSQQGRTWSPWQRCIRLPNRHRDTQACLHTCAHETSAQTRNMWLRPMCGEKLNAYTCNHICKHSASSNSFSFEITQTVDVCMCMFHKACALKSQGQRNLRPIFPIVLTSVYN